MLPILISIPHGGTETPPEVEDISCITPEALFDDSDAYTREIYDVTGEVAHIERAEIARAFIDLNRAPDDRPPANPDGVVKMATCYDEPIYQPGREPSTRVTEALLGRYYHPYHEHLREAAQDPRLRLALDCHSMAALPPAVAPDAGRPRPLFCLSNDSGRTCPQPLIEGFAHAIADAFELRRSDVMLNVPFKGGFITRSHGVNSLPWIQVEMNRSLYLTEPWFDRATLTVAPERLNELRSRFLAALRQLALR
jgi:N-formylglutamate deformylase